MARMKPLVLIPARMASTRLPGKPLADIAGKPMIVRVAERAVAAGIGPVVVCTDDADIAAAVRAAGIETAMTADTHLSGSDRIFEALTKLDPRGDVPVIVNVQGDLPALDPSAIRTAVKQLDDPSIDIGTIAAQIKREAEKTNPNVVKVVGTPVGPRRLRALYFTRATAPYGDGPIFHHIGLYAYRRAALEKFVALPQSTLEKREKLEQLRALEAGMTIGVGIVGGVPLGVDTQEDLDRARQMFVSKKG